MRTIHAILAALSLLTGATVGVLAQTGDEAEPDLVPTDLTTEGSEPVEGDDVAFTATIANDGDADAGSSFNVTFLVDGDRLGENKTIDGLAFGHEAQVTSDNWTAEADEHEVTVLVDPHDDVSEADETNNELATTVDVARAEVDFAVTALDWEPRQPVEGEDVQLSAQIENRGNVSANETTLRFLVDGAALGQDVNVSALEPGENTTVDSENWTAEEGDHDLRAFVDPQRETDEADETNNEEEAVASVDPDEANLQVGNVTLSPSEPEPGDDVTFEATITNDGHQPAENATVAFEIDGEPLSNLTIAQLAEDDSVDVASEAWNATEGDHEVEVRADVDDNVTEIDETDNTAARAFAVAERLPDLEPTDLEAPTNVTEDDEIALDATVANTGDEGAENVTVSFLVDGELVSNETIATLGPGDDANVTSEEWEASEGNHTLTVDVDPDDAVREHDEANNDRSVDFTVAQAEDDGDEIEEDDESEETITICHIPPGNPDARHTKEIGKPAWEAHEDHGDHKGACEDGHETDEASSDPGENDTEDDEREAEGNGHGNGKARGPP